MSFLRSRGTLPRLLALVLLFATPAVAADDPSALFGAGIAAVAEAEAAETDDLRDAALDRAINVFHTILVNEPGADRVRLELARAFFLKGDDTLARDHFERVLAGELPAAVIANVQRFLNAMRERRRWSAYFGLALVPDTNPGAASDADVIYIYDLPFRRNHYQGAESGFGLALWGGGEYRYPLDDSLCLRFGADLVHRDYPGGLFDSSLLAAHAGPCVLIDKDTEASVLLTAQRRLQAGEPTYDSPGLRIEVDRRLTDRLTMRVNATWERRNFVDSSYLDASITSLAVHAAWVVMPTVRLDGWVGYRAERTASEPWRNTTRWGSLRTTVALPWGFTVGGGAAMHLTRYQGRWFPFVRDGTSRRDTILALHASVLNRQVTVLGFSPQFVVTNERRVSNAQLHDYQRSRVELRFQRLF